MSEKNAMCSTVWVGRVKSTVPPLLLKEAFAEFGTIIRVETGFAGFAFVEFDEIDPAHSAIKALNKTTIQGVGEIHCAMATYRGYEDAVRKRDAYRREKGLDTSEYGGIGGGKGSEKRTYPAFLDSGSRGIRSPRRRRSSPSVRRRRSPSGRRRKESRSRSKRKRRGRSGSYSSGSPRRGRERSSPSRAPLRRPSPVPPLRPPLARVTPVGAKPQPVGAAPLPVGAAPLPVPTKQPQVRDPGAPRQKYHWLEDVGDPSKDPYAQGKAQEAIENGRGDSGANGYDEEGWEEPGMPELKPNDRSDVLCFFDGSGAYDLLLEASSVLRAALPDCLNGFPHAFPGLNQNDAAALLNVVAGFVESGGADDDVGKAGGPKERSVEVRQSFSVDAKGRRLLRKTIMVDGVSCFSEKFKLEENGGS